MPKLSFIFCTQCQKSFVKPLENKFCPVCKQNFDSPPEEWELDPFEPQSWPFPIPKVKSKFYEKSTNEQYYTTTGILYNINRYLSHLFFITISIGSFIFPFRTFPKQEWFSNGFWCVFAILAVMAMITAGVAIHSLEKRFITIDNKNIYITSKFGFITGNTLVLDRRSCTPKLERPYKNYKVENYKVVLTYPAKGEIKQLIIGSPNEIEIRKALDNMRWLSTYVQFAYNENLLPEPTPKIGHEDITVDADTQSNSCIEQPVQDDNLQNATATN